MQIIINQEEIELAIRNYVREIVSLRDGMDIEIEFKATRGEAGMQALIDINPAKPEVVTKGDTNLGLVKAINTAKKETPAVAETKTEETPAKDSPEASESSDEVPAEGTRQSLFGTLKRPVNA